MRRKRHVLRHKKDSTCKVTAVSSYCEYVFNICPLGYNVTVVETDTGGTDIAGGSYGNPPGSTFTATSGGNSSRRAPNPRNDAGDDTTSNTDTIDDGIGDDDAPPTIGISSRGRIVRSKFNVRKHLASSKKQTL